MTEIKTNAIPHRLKNVNKEHPYVSGAKDIYDDVKDKSQEQVNKDVDDTLALHQSEINALDSQNYVTVDSYSGLPDLGAVDTIYRVSNWDGTQVDATKYSEYAWNNTGIDQGEYVLLDVKTQVGEVFDISQYKAVGGVLATFADLSAALNGGNNVPAGVRHGGMSVKFVSSVDNKYVQYRYMSSSTAAADFTNTANWQGVDEILKSNSHNIPESGSVAKEVIDIKGDVEESEGYTYNHGVQKVAKVASANGTCYVIPIYSGAQRTIIRAQGGSAARLWYFTDDDLNIIGNYADASAVADNLTLTAPAGATKLIVNNIGSEEAIIGTVGKLDKDVFKAFAALYADGYVYAGKATPSTTPVTGKVFYVATQAGTYTNFGGLSVTHAINFLKYNGSTWQKDTVINIDNKPIPSSDELVRSGGVRNAITEEAELFNAVTLTGNGSTPVQKDFSLIAGHKYKIKISTNNFERSTIAATAYSFYIGYWDGSGMVELYGYKGSDTIDTKEFEITAVDAQPYRILFRADVGEVVYYQIIDVTAETENLEKFYIKATLDGDTPFSYDIVLKKHHRYLFKLNNKNYTYNTVSDNLLTFFIGVASSEGYLPIYSATKEALTDTDYIVNVQQAQTHRIFLRGDKTNASILIGIYDLGVNDSNVYEIRGLDNTVAYCQLPKLDSSCTYRIKILTPNWSRENVSSDTYFTITHRNSANTTDLIDVDGSDRYIASTESYIGLSGYYDVKTPWYDTLFSIGIRADKGEVVKIKVEKVKGENALVEALTSFHPSVITVIGDSISSYASCYKNGGHFLVPENYAFTYPRVDSNVLNNTQMWWWKVAEISGAKINQALAFAGSTTSTKHHPSLYERANVMELTPAAPDCVIIALGTNDYNLSVPLGNYDYDVAIESLDETKFRSAYIKGIKEIQRRIPSAKIVCAIMRMDDNNEGYSDSIKTIAEHYSLQWIDCRGYQRYDYALGGSHPSAIGHLQIANKILKEADNRQ